MRILAAALAFSVSPFVLAQALAADIEASSHVDAVTVYPDGAMVTRLAEIAVPPGASALIVRGLPSVLDPASIRVEALMDNTLAIGSVEARLSPADPSATANPELDAKIASLREESDRVAVRIEALEVKQKTILRYSELDPKRLARKSNPEDASSWKITWDTIGDELGRVNEELRVERAKADELEKRLSTLEKAREPTPGAGDPKRDIVIAVEAAAAAKGSLALTYRVTQANWTPRYEARFATAKEAKPSLELIRRAAIVQRTGEDWENVVLSVSTVRTLGGTAVPQLSSLKVALVEPAQPNVTDKLEKQSNPQVGLEADIDWAGKDGLPSSNGQNMPMRKSAPVSNPGWGSAQLSESYDATLGLQPVAAQSSFAALNAGSYQASFRISGRVSVPRDGSQKTFALSTASFAPELLARVTPALDQRAYLEASFVETEEAPLLPGEVSITRDGVFVGKGRFPLVAPGDKAVLGLGADDRVKIVRVPLRQEDNAPSWIGNTRSRVTEFKTSVKNLHDTKIKVAVLDRMPVSETDRVVVETLPTNTQPSENNVADQRGTSGWNLDLTPGEQKDIRFGWRLNWPADRELSLGARPVLTGQAIGGAKF